MIYVCTRSRAHEIKQVLAMSPWSRSGLRERGHIYLTPDCARQLRKSTDWVTDSEALGPG